MLLLLSTLALCFQLGRTQASTAALLPIHNLTRSAHIKFENLAIRSNGQILATSTVPNASIYQFDPLGILPVTLLYQISNATNVSALGIAEGRQDVFYVASGKVNIANPFETDPSSYTITEIDVRGVEVAWNGTVMSKPKAKKVASLPGASLLNGVAFARPQSNNLLVADSFRGLIWNVDIHDGSVGVTLNSSSTKGPTKSGPTFTGVNGIKEQNGTLYWTNTGANALYKVPIDKHGNIAKGAEPTIVAANLTCDDLVIDSDGTAYVAGPLDIITRVSPSSEKRVIAGIFNSTESGLVGPTAVRFGRLVSDSRSLYITTNGGLGQGAPGTAGLSRIDLR